MEPIEKLTKEQIAGEPQALQTARQQAARDPWAGTHAGEVARDPRQAFHHFEVVLRRHPAAGFGLKVRFPNPMQTVCVEEVCPGGVAEAQTHEVGADLLPGDILKGANGCETVSEICEQLVYGPDELRLRVERRAPIAATQPRAPPASTSAAPAAVAAGAAAAWYAQIGGGRSGFGPQLAEDSAVVRAAFEGRAADAAPMVNPDPRSSLADEPGSVWIKRKEPLLLRCPKCGNAWEPGSPREKDEPAFFSSGLLGT